jgi:hypothetical protein
MKSRFLFLFLFGYVFCYCNSLRMEDTVFDIKNDKGLVVERYGNHNTPDLNTNFRTFYFYNGRDLLIREKRYFFEDSNKECKIIDSLDYTDIHYKYNDQNKMILEEIYQPKYDMNGRVLQHFLAYRKNYITGKTETFQEPQ